MAGVEGIEPSHTEPESAVLPLDYTPNYPKKKSRKLRDYKYGWAGRIRTPECMDQNHVSYHLTTAQLLLVFYGGEGGIRTHGEVLPPHTLSRRAPSASSVTSPETLRSYTWRRMRDSNPQGQSPAVFKTAVLPIRTNPPIGLCQIISL